MRQHDCRFAASVLTLDFAGLGEAIAPVAKHVDYIHLDVMDGHFVPALSFGSAAVSAIAERVATPIDVHLMIANAEQRWRDYARAGASRITVHHEAICHLPRILADIRSEGIRAGVALCPATPSQVLQPILNWIDQIIVMTVNPGLGGQSYLENADSQIASVVELLEREGYRQRIKVMADGGINRQTIDRAFQAGAREFVLGSSLFQPDRDPISELAALEKILAQQ